MRRLPLLLLLVACLYGCSRTPGPTLDPVEIDPDVSRALRSAHLGRADAVQAAGRMLLDHGNSTEYRRASAAASILAASTEHPVPPRKDARRDFKPVSRTQAVRAWELVKNRVAPTDRWLEARADRRYDTFQRSVDGVLGPLANAAQGQFFSLLTLPFAAADWLAVGRVYLTPEQRRELQLARRVVADPLILQTEAEEKIDPWRERRRKLGALQATRNGREAHKTGDLETALFWYGRAAALRANDDPPAALEKVRQEISEARLSRRNSLSMSGGDTRFSTRAELASYGTMLRAHAAGDTDAFAAEARLMRARMPWSRLLPTLDAATAAHAHRSGDSRLAAVWLAALAETDDSPWAERAEALLQRPHFDPLPVLEDAQNRIDRRRRAFLIEGTDPYRPPRSHTAEEARRGRTIWIDRARALFVTDILSRTLFLPFLDPFPRREMLDAAAQVDDGWFDREEAESWLRRIARANEVERRWDAAVKTWERLGDDKRAERTAHRAARRLERTARRAPSPREATAIYNRILNAWSDYRHLERVREARDRAHIRSQAIAVIPRALIKSYPDFLASDALDMSPHLVDGRRSNGEIAREGVWLLPWGAYVYNDEDTRRDIEVPLPRENVDVAIALLIERQRLASDHTELRKPRPRRRIPLEVEAGIFPGFDVSPGLVPLTPEQRERELYE
ncbi:MAG: hypothetical protein JJU11_09975 [Candidatus Sumerlaeia bacterium]|nr:hypothetical protein [Candidatus Sumerlaeia bacterium]